MMIKASAIRHDRDSGRRSGPLHLVGTAARRVLRD